MLGMILGFLLWFAGSHPAHAGMSIHCYAWNGVTQPTVAATDALNCLKFNEDWQGGTQISQAVDVADTRTPGFDWYVHNAWTATAGCTAFQSGYNAGPADTSANFSLVPNGLSYNGPTSGSNTPGSASIYQIGSGSGIGGFSVTPPYVVDVIASSLTSEPGGVTGGSWPAVWSETNQWLNGSINAGGTNGYFNEIDFLENTPGASSFNLRVHEWNCAPSGTGTHWASAQGFPALPPGSPHTYLFEHLPAGASGTGKMIGYQDGTAYGEVDYSALGSSCGGRVGGCFESDTQDRMWFISAGNPTWPLTIGHFRVWQK